MKNLRESRNILKKAVFIILIIVIAAFFALPSFAFAEGEGTATTETAQTAVTQDTTGGANVDTGTATTDSTTEPVTTEVTTTTDQTVTTDTIVTTDTTVTTDTSDSSAVTTPDTANDADATVTTNTPAVNADSNSTDINTTVTSDSAAAATTDTANDAVTTDDDATTDNAVDAANKPVFAPFINAGKADYNPGEEVTIFGGGFVPGETVSVSFINSEGAAEHSGTVVADEKGSFIYSYAIIGSIEYTVSATSIINNISATTKFLDSAYAQFIAAGPSLPGSQFYEERMDMNVVLNDGSGTTVPMYAFCIDLQHYLDTTGLWDVIGFKDFNDPSQGPAGKEGTPLVTWQLPSSVYALARSLDPAWLNSDSGGFTKDQKAAAVQEAFWTLVSAANSTDGNNFNYQSNGIPAIQGLVTTLITNANMPQAQVKSVVITPASDLNYLQDDVNLNKHDLNITTYDYLGNVITGVPVNVTVTGKGFFDANTRTQSIIAASGAILSLYADKNDFLGLNIGTDLINCFIDVNNDQNIDTSSLPGNVSTDLIGSILWPNNRSYPNSTSLPWGSNQLLILTGLYEPQAQATKEWRIPGEITVHKSDGVDSTISLAGAIISLLDPNTGNPATDAWGNPIADQITDGNGDISGFKGLTWGNTQSELQGVYTVHEKTPPAGYELTGDQTVTIGSNIQVINTENTKGTNNLNLIVSIGMQDSRITPSLTLIKTDSVTGNPVAGAEYWVYDNNGVHVETLLTGSDGSVIVSSLKWYIAYTVKEVNAPSGYTLDPASYPVTFGPTNTNATLNVKDSPTGGGGPTPTPTPTPTPLQTITVAGITTPGITPGIIQVLAFTGMDPIIPISGGSAVMGGLAMLLATLRKRQEKKWKHAKK